MNILVLGLNPSAAKKLKKNSTFDRLNKWMDHLGVVNYSFMNVIPEVGAPDIKKVTFHMTPFIERYDGILALGNTVSLVLTNLGIEHFKMPHPSPRNRLLNDKTFEINMLDKCKEYLS